MLTGLALLRAVEALEECGAFSALEEKKNEGMNIETLSKILRVDEKLLEALCDFVYVNAPEILEKRIHTYYLGPGYFDPRFQNILNFGMAYEPVFARFLELMRGTMLYGKDVHRRGKYLQKSRALYNQEAWNKIINMLLNKNFDVLVDIGCGSGEFLREACVNIPSIYGIGIEADKDTYLEAIKNLRGKKEKGRVTIVEGNAKYPERWARNIAGGKKYSNVVFTGITVWHEFLYKGETHLCNIFSRYKELFPESIFIVAEYNGLSIEALQIRDELFRGPASVYQLVHPFSHQGMLQDIEAWEKIFEKSGIFLEEKFDIGRNLTAYICRL